MITQDAVLVQLIRLIDRLPAPSPPARRPRDDRSSTRSACSSKPW